MKSRFLNSVPVRNGQLLLIIAFAIGIRLLFFHGFVPHVDIDYESYALKLARGEYIPPFNGPTARWAMVIPLTILYRIFGFNTFSSTLIAFTCSICGVYLGYLFVKKFDSERTALIAALLLAAFPLEIMYSTQVMVDVPLSLMLLLTLFLFLHAHLIQTSPPKKMTYALSGFVFGIAYGLKLEALIVLPFFFLYFLFRRRFDFQFIWFVLAFGLVLLAETLIFYIISENLFERFLLTFKERSDFAHVALSDPNSSYCNNLCSNHLYLYWMFLDIHYTGPSFIFMIISFLILFFKKHASRVIKTSFGWPLLLWSGTILIVLTFFPLSLKPYIPLYKFMYYIVMFSAPLLIFFAIVLKQFSYKYQNLVIIIIVLCCFPSLYISKETNRTLLANPTAIHEFYREANYQKPLYASWVNVYAMRYFDNFKNDQNYIDFNLRVDEENDVMNSNKKKYNSSFVAIDEFDIEYYGNMGRKYPPEILTPPQEWHQVFIYQRDDHFLKKHFKNFSDFLYEKRIIDIQIKNKLEKKLEEWSHSKPVIIYEVN